jgi:hypothetical protein
MITGVFASAMTIVAQQSRQIIIKDAISFFNKIPPTYFESTGFGMNVHGRTGRSGTAAKVILSGRAAWPMSKHRQGNV